MGSQIPKPLKSAEIGLLRIMNLPEAIALQLKDTNGDGAFTPADTEGSSEKAITELAHATVVLFDDHPIKAQEIVVIRRTRTDETGAMIVEEKQMTRDITLPRKFIEAGLKNLYSNLADNLQTTDQLVKIAQKIGGLSPKTVEAGKSIPQKNWDGALDLLSEAAVNLRDLEENVKRIMLNFYILDAESITPPPKEEETKTCWTYLSNAMILKFLEPTLQQLQSDLAFIGNNLSGITFCKGEKNDKCSDKFPMPHVKTCLVNGR